MQDPNDGEHLELIVRLIDMIDRRLSPIIWEKFREDEDEIDLTSFRLLHLGESARKLSTALQARHPHIEWARIYRTRNVISHTYASILAELVWGTSKNELGSLRRVCIEELDAVE